MAHVTPIRPYRAHVPRVFRSCFGKIRISDKHVMCVVRVSGPKIKRSWSSSQHSTLLRWSGHCYAGTPVCYSLSAWEMHPHHWPGRDFWGLVYGSGSPFPLCLGCLFPFLSPCGLPQFRPLCRCVFPFFLLEGRPGMVTLLLRC